MGVSDIFNGTNMEGEEEKRRGEEVLNQRRKAVNGGANSRIRP